MNKCHQFCRLLPVFVIIISISVIQCATPTNPTGGPADREGPEVIGTRPESGTTNFEGNSVGFVFNEFIERSSLEDALQIEPELNMDVEADWGRKSVDITFDRELPDSTTLIVTLGTDLSDVRGNKMASPVTVAVSTGPDIDRGEIKAQIRDSDTGLGLQGERILLYQQPVDLNEAAVYSGESDTSGTVQFKYLAPGNYKAFWINDKNRNRKWDKEIEEAQPFRKEFINLEQNDSDSLGIVFVQTKDTLAPELQGIGLLSQVRMRLRFSEDMLMTDSSGIEILDTLGNRFTDANPLYIPDESPFVVFAQSRQPLEEDQSYQAEITGITDKAGNPVQKNNMMFDGSSQQDTTLQRIISVETGQGLFPEEPLRIIYARSFENNALADSLIAIKGNAQVEPWPEIDLVANKMLLNPIDGEWDSGVPYEFRVFNPKILQRETYEPNFWFESDFGALEFVREDSLYQNPLVLKLFNKESEINRNVTFSKSETIKRLPPLSYTAIIFYDRNDNGKWDRGSVDPYQAPEPMFIRRNLQVRSGFTATVPVEF